MTNQLVERGYLTQSLGNASHSGEHGFKAVPGLLKLAIEKRAWEERIIIETGEEFEGFSDFESYIKANPPKGLGIDIASIERLISSDTNLLGAFHAAIREAHPNGGDRKSKEAKGKISFNIVKTDLPQGNSKAYALQKLTDEAKKDKRKAELLEQVKAGKISANAAMKAAGLRRPRVAIYLDDPKSAAKTLVSHASPTFLDELRRLLSD